ASIRCLPTAGSTRSRSPTRAGDHLPLPAAGTAGLCVQNVGGLAVAEDGAAGFRQLADQPVGLQRIAEPRFGPTLVDAAAHRALADSLAPLIEQRQLAAGLPDATAQPLPLLRRGPVLAAEVENERFLKHSQISVCYIVEFRIYSWLTRRQEGCWRASLRRRGKCSNYLQS